jgi:cysteinyl-tRNA synthetase
MLNIYNSLTRAKQRFVALQSGKVGMYVCGMTVYDFCHLGHARVLVVFDLVSRWLQTSGYDVIYVRNITDIDDKIIKRALENGEPFQHLTERFIEAMNEDAAALGVRKPEFEPRATANIPQMLQLIGKLIDKGMAYRADNGDVYYVVHKFNGYGKLSGKSLEQLRAGARVDIDPNKREPLDFVLWKAAKAGEPSWDSPWGKGRPGWHIECSAMSERYLGTHFDIHGGGQDLQFPHHENEIAQSEGAHGHTFVNYWMHNGFVRIDDEKMSKSLGNFFTVREVLHRYDAEVVRFFIARAHYRSPLNYSDHHLDDARQALTRLYTALKAFDVDSSSYVIDWDHAYAKRFREAMNDDFNTPEAVAVLFELANEVNRSHSRELALLMRALGAVLGLLERDPVDFLQSGEVSDLSAEQIETRIIARKAARKDKNFAEADRIRDELLSMGVVLEDASDATTWRRS